MRTTCLVLWGLLSMVWSVSPGEAAERPFGHMVFFDLKDRSEADRAKLVAACHKYLSNHEGTLYFSVGAIASEMKRDVNDTDFDVALHLVFESKAAHDKYHSHPRHLKFIEEHRELWKRVRVFDSYLTEP